MTDSFQSYRGRRVLVTGATGLIGSWLTKSLLQHASEIHALVLPEPERESELLMSGDIGRVRVHSGRLEDAAALARVVEDSQPEIVFHLGAQPLVPVARADPVGTLEANVAGSWQLLEACRRLSPPPLAIAVASSDKAYGTTDKLPYLESDPIGGSGEPYEASKAMTDIIARTYAKTYGLRVRVARCGNIYGGGDWNWSRIIPGTIRSLLRGERPVIRGNGKSVRDYVHVDDVVDAYLRLGVHDIEAGDAFNFSSGEHRTVLEIVELIQRMLGTNLSPVIRDQARGEIDRQYLDSSKARAELRWSPRRTLEESLPGVISWYQDLLTRD